MKYSYLGQNVYVEEQGDCKVSLLQADRKYPLSQFYSNEGAVKTITNCSYFTSDYVLGRNQGDTYNEAPDQDFYSVVVREDNTYDCGKFASWEHRNGITAGFSCACVLILHGAETDLYSPAIEGAKARLTTKNPNTAFGFTKQGKAVLIVNEGRNANDNGLTGYELRDFAKKNLDLDLLVLLDGGGSTEMIVDGEIVNTLSDGSERPMFNGLSFVDTKATQMALLPPRKTWVTQGINGSYSHVGTKAIDFGSLRSYIDETYNLYAPFDCKVVWADTIAKGGTVALQSLKPVIYADGTVDFMTVISEHSNDRPAAGTVFKQGQIYAHMGTAGGVAKHCHIEVQKGRFVKPTTTRYQPGCSMYVYMFANTVNPYDALFITKDTVIDPASVESYPWRVATAITDPVERDTSRNQLRVLADLLRVREDHSTSAASLGFAVPNAYYNDLEIFQDGYTWHKIADGQWIADNGEWIELLPAEDTESLKRQIDDLTDKIIHLKADIDDRDTLIKVVQGKLETAFNENKKLQLMYDDLLEDHDKAVAMCETLSEKYTLTINSIKKAYEQVIEAFKGVM